MIFTRYIAAEEVLALRLVCNNYVVLLFAVYHPTHSTPLLNAQFLALASSLCSSYKLVVLLGDFNYWAESEYNTPFVCILADGLEALDLT